MESGSDSLRSGDDVMQGICMYVSVSVCLGTIGHLDELAFRLSQSLNCSTLKETERHRLAYDQ